MAKSSKPVELMNKHLTKDEMESRRLAEEGLKSPDDLVYIVPDWLNEEEAKVYQTTIDILRDTKLLSNGDIENICTLSNAVVMMRKMKKDIDENGYVLQRKDKAPIKNPAITIYKEYQALYDKMAQRLCLTMDSKAKMAQITLSNNAKQNNPVLKALKRK